MTSFSLPIDASTKSQTLIAGETGFIGPSGILAVDLTPGDPSSTTAIQIDSGPAAVTVFGTVVAKFAINGPNAQNTSLVVGNGGVVAGTGTTINLGAGAEIVNDGTISSQTSRALRLHDGDNHLVNAGMIAGQVVIQPGNSVGFAPVNHLENAAGGIIAADGTALRVAPALATTEVVVNDGAIYGDLKLGAMGDTVVNRGIIASDVRLGAGDDVYRGGGDVNGRVLGGSGNDLLKGGASDDVLLGGGGQDNVRGNDGDDVLVGNAGHDTLRGGAGDDTLNGGRTTDLLIGGTGADHFVFDSLVHPGHDVIEDFEQGTDLIDFSAFSILYGLPHLTFVGSQDFSGTQPELRYEARAAKTIVNGDADGDGSRDFRIVLTGHFDLHATDFVL